MPSKRPPPTRKRVTKAQHAERVNQVIDLMLGGAHARDIVRFGADQKWDVCRRAIEKYITKAYEVIAAECDKDRHRAFNKAVTRLERLYGRSLSSDQLVSALATQKELNALLGLYPTVKTLNFNVSTGKADLSRLSVEELALLDSLLAKLESPSTT